MKRVAASNTARRFPFHAGSLFFALALTIAGAVRADAAPAVAVCGDATGDGVISSSDALIALRTAVGTSTCVPPRCDTNHSGKITSTDAHTILKSAVGQLVGLHCPPAEEPGSTTTTTSTTVTTTTSVAAVCGN